MLQFIRIHEYTTEAFSTFDGTEVVITPELVLFWKPPNPFSQWTVSPFEIDGMTYNCAEQFMMAEKARMFGDVEIENQILSSDCPQHQKRLGRQISGFDERQWVAERCKIVFRGNVAKFSQNDELRALLLETGDRRMAEASPIDKIWGIGFAANNPSAYDSSLWTGLNLLGKVLEDVRSYIMGIGKLEQDF